jgi:hypothetical protein
MSAQGQGGYGGGYGMQQPQYGGGGWGGGYGGGYQQPQQQYRQPNYSAWGGQQQQQPQYPSLAIPQMGAATAQPAVQPPAAGGGDSGGGYPAPPSFTPGFAPQPGFGWNEGTGGARGVVVPGKPPIGPQPITPTAMPIQGMGLLQQRYNQPYPFGQYRG